MSVLDGGLGVAGRWRNSYALVIQPGPVFRISLLDLHLSFSLYIVEYSTMVASPQLRPGTRTLRVVVSPGPFDCYINRV